jgi:shikimate kinase
MEGEGLGSSPFSILGRMGGKTVWLVGMMGAGKSSVGVALAELLGVPFVDTDAEVESRAGAKVAELFAREGEAGFRARELEAVESCLGRPAVVALGGGALTRSEVRQRIARQGRVVYLRARPESLAARVGTAPERPLLQGLDAEGRLARLQELLAARERDYERGALVVDTDGLDVGAVADAVARRLGA